MSIEIRRVSSRKEMSLFVKFPYHLYKNHPYWVPPLLIEQKDLVDVKRNPFYKHSEAVFYLAFRNGQVVGRIAGILNHNHNEFHNENIGFFGFFESINDKDVSAKLFESVENWARSKGLDEVRGPVNPSTNDSCGILIEGFDKSPCFMMPYNYDYYPNLCESYGFEKAKDLYSYYISQEMLTPKVMQRLENGVELVLKRKNAVIRPVDLKNFDEEVKKVKEVYNNAWSKNWGFVPLTDDEINHIAKGLKQIVVPEITLFAEINGKPIGFSLSVPDINQALKGLNGRLLPFGIFKLMRNMKKITMIRVMIMGLVHEYRFSGIDAAFYYYTIKNGIAKGFSEAELGWVLEDNEPMKRVAENLGSTPYKKYRIYTKKLR
ncbi:MAG: N-acetyltransferase [Candidatus Kryptonium sp.]|nr:N-acetyltransferase [Candidatus Kryptonium sp.]